MNVEGKRNFIFDPACGIRYSIFKSCFSHTPNLPYPHTVSNNNYAAGFGMRDGLKKGKIGDWEINFFLYPV